MEGGKEGCGAQLTVSKVSRQWYCSPVRGLICDSAPRPNRQTRQTPFAVAVQQARESRRVCGSGFWVGVRQTARNVPTRRRGRRSSGKNLHPPGDGRETPPQTSCPGRWRGRTRRHDPHCSGASRRLAAPQSRTSAMSKPCAAVQHAPSTSGTTARRMLGTVARAIQAQGVTAQEGSERGARESPLSARVQPSRYRVLCCRPCRRPPAEAEDEARRWRLDLISQAPHGAEGACV